MWNISECDFYQTNGLKCARVLREGLPEPVLIFGSETRIRDCWVLGKWIEYPVHGLELCRVKKKMDENGR